MSTTIAPPAMSAPEDETFTITGLSWDQYVTINDALGDQAGLRVLFFDGSLTFVSPAFIHEWSENYWDSIVKAIAVGCDIEMIPIGSTTLRKAKGEVGLEGDQVYYLGEKAILMAGMKTLDLAVDPPPDLAIEVENTHKATEVMAIYARLGVPEVWRHDVRRKTLTFWALQPDGAYHPTPQSRGFPFLTPADILFQVERAEEIPSMIRWLGQLADWVREVIRPRLDAV